MGFGYAHYADARNSVTMVCVPYWFLIVFFSVALFFVWRKTRPKFNPNTAFPIEPSKLKAAQVGKAV